MEAARKVTDDTYILPSYFPIPGYGLVPVNAFVVKSAQPMLVDTGLHHDAGEFVSNLRAVIDPMELRWLYLTHPDQDHLGSLKALLAEAPQLKVITTFLGVGIMSLFDPLPLDRVHLLNPGESLDLGDRTITVMKPPSFDNPATTGFYDSKSGALYSSDCFGALVQEPAAEAGEINATALAEGQTLWSAIDAPWLHKVDRNLLGAELKKIEEIDPKVVLSSHLPPARSMSKTLLSNLATVPDSPPFVGPDQVALEAMLATMTQGRPPEA